jgi:RNA recognition motif-containing protein
LTFIHKINFEMNIYVGNLNWSLTSDDLYNLFSPYGEVTSAKIVTDKFNNNRSKGFGFVEMSNDEAARQAISNLHDTEVGGRKIVVNESAPRKEGEGGYKKKNTGGGGYNRGGGGGGYNRSGGGGGGYNRNRGEGGGGYNRY